MKYEHDGIWRGENSQKFEFNNPFWDDNSFDDFMKLNPRMVCIKKYLPKGLADKIFSKQRDIERSVPSTYKKHGFGYLFYGLVRCIKPNQVVELGVYQGFSLLTIAAALHDNSQGNICGFDIFEDYQYRHDTFDNVSERIKKFNFESVATIQKADYTEVHKNFKDIDILHVDVSNNGDVFGFVFEKWSSKVKKLIIFEGGGEERDQVSWMIRYQKKPIRKALDEIKKKYLEWEIHVLTSFPSVTIAVKKEKTVENIINSDLMK